MKVKCVSNVLSVEQKSLLGMKLEFNPKYQITVGSNYLVLGLTFLTENRFSKGPMYLIQEDKKKYCATIPACLFDILDPRPSKYWNVKYHGNGSLTLWPDTFYQEYFFDDLTEGENAIKDSYIKIYQMLDDEFERLGDRA